MYKAKPCTERQNTRPSFMRYHALDKRFHMKYEEDFNLHINNSFIFRNYVYQISPKSTSSEELLCNNRINEYVQPFRDSFLIALFVKENWWKLISNFHKIDKSTKIQINLSFFDFLSEKQYVRIRESNFFILFIFSYSKTKILGKKFQMLLEINVKR